MICGKCDWCRKEKEVTLLQVRDSMAMRQVCADCLKGNEMMFEVKK